MQTSTSYIVCGPHGVGIPTVYVFHSPTIIHQTVLPTVFKSTWYINVFVQCLCFSGGVFFVSEDCLDSGDSLVPWVPPHASWVPPGCLLGTLWSLLGLGWAFPAISPNWPNNFKWLKSHSKGTLAVLGNLTPQGWSGIRKVAPWINRWLPRLPTKKKTLGECNVYVLAGRCIFMCPKTVWRLLCPGCPLGASWVPYGVS